MKISVIGAGSYTFGASFLHQLIEQSLLDGYELHLVDPSLNRLDLMLAVANQLARVNDRRVKLTCSKSADRGMEGTDYLVVAAASDLQNCFLTTVRAIREYAPTHMVSEFGGVHGFAYSIRQLAMLDNLLAVSDVQCPGADVLMMSNPLPRQCTYARNRGYDVTGFCSVSAVVCQLVGSALNFEVGDFPFDEARSRYDIRCGGTNHLTWVESVLDRVSGENVVSRIVASLLKRDPTTLTLRTLQETGCLASNGDDHIRDFLPPFGAERGMTEIAHGTARERALVESNLARFATGELTWDEVGNVESWERPADWIEARELKMDAEFSAINRPNEGQIPGLAPEAIVESPCEIRSGEVDLTQTRLHDRPLEHNRLAIAITEGLADAYEEKSWAILDDLILLDPTCIDKQACKNALRAALLGTQGFDRT